MSDSIVERIRDALACPVEHPVPKEVFSSLIPFNPMTMEVVADISDDEIRILRLLNEISHELVRTKAELKEGAKNPEYIAPTETHLRFATCEMMFDILSKLLLAASIERVGFGTNGQQYGLSANGKVIRARATTTMTH